MRINELLYWSIVVLFAFLFGCKETGKSKDEEMVLPNILWIVSEDNSPFLGCYGDSLAITSNIDQLASEGMLYTNAFSNAPVCAPARHTIITGTYANGNGTENMRSTYPIDSTIIHFYPYYLKKAGYYTANRHKTDYNTYDQDSVWDDSSREAHYTNRKHGQPFFQIVNIGDSHEGRIHPGSSSSLVYDYEKMVLPPYHPDNEAIRKERAWYYGQITIMDSLVGDIIQELKDNGLYDETIIFYYSDHGGVLARSKRFLYESGQHVPFIVRVPEKYRHLFPDYKNGVNEKLISFVDLAPTMLDLAGISPKEYFDGWAFNQSAPSRKYVYGYSSRQGEKVDMSRSVRDSRYLLIRNFFPQVPGGKHNSYMFRQTTINEWKKVCENGNCNAAQMAFWKRKPIIELFDCEADPHNIVNLADSVAMRGKMEELNRELIKWMIVEKDKGIIHELERNTLEKIQAIDQWNDAQYQELLNFAIAVTEDAPLTEDQLLQSLEKDRYHQYWVLHYLVKNKVELSDRLMDKVHSLNDSRAVSVKINANLVLLQNNEPEAVQMLINLLHLNNPMIGLYVFDGLTQLSPEKREPLMDEAHKIGDITKWKRFDVRIALNLIEGKYN